MKVLTGACLVTPAGVVENGWVQLDHERIGQVGEGRPPTGDLLDLGGGWLVPAYLDIHCHGGDGSDFASADPDQLRQAAALHLRHGSTGVLASLVTAPIADLAHQLAVVAEVVEAGDTSLVGAHLEGPYLSRLRCGAQNPQHLLLPDVTDFAKLLDASRGVLKMITIAPELPGAIELITAATAAGVVAAVGHTDANYDQTSAAFEAGATVATHLFNGMRPIHHREPGPVLAALDAGAGCEVINDGVHVHPSVLRLVADRGRDQLLLITDAISATGTGDGHYQLGGQQVTVAGGQARLTANGSLAGSTVTMDLAVQRAVHEAGLPVESAVAAATSNPARLMGMSGERGSIATGLVADLIHLDSELTLLRVMRNGSWLQ